METTLREHLATAVESAPVIETPEPVAELPEKSETPEQKTERLRDESGKFMAQDKTPEPKMAKAPKIEPAKIDPPAKTRPDRPSSWKKEYWDHWDKIDPNLAEYLHQRESEFSKGVSTYKAEADRAKSIFDAIAPYQQTLQQHGISPEQEISRLMGAHHTLTSANLQQRMQMFQKLAQDYNVPLQLLVDPQQAGTLSPVLERVQQLEGTFNNYLQSQEQAQQAKVTNEIRDFAKDKPHFEQVRETMAGLLQSGLADDLNSAHDAALRLPKHSEIWDQLQEQQRKTDDEKRKSEELAKVQKARAQAVSPKTTTPTGSSSGGKKGLRELLRESMEANEGRV